jgi:hypothetical protein
MMSKLILGELVHAMPHMAEPVMTMNEIVTSVGHDSSPCGSHSPSGTESQQFQDSNGDDHAADNCCKVGECACPCLNSPAATAVVLIDMQLAHDDQMGVLVEGAARHRLSGLFRPPA